MISEPPLLVSSSETTTPSWSPAVTHKLENAPRIYFCAANILIINIICSAEKPRTTRDTDPYVLRPGAKKRR